MCKKTPQNTVYRLPQVRSKVAEHDQQLFSRFIRLVKAAAAPLVGIFYLNHVGDLAALLVLVSLIGGNTVHLASGDQLPGAMSKGLFVVFLTSVNFM